MKKTIKIMSFLFLLSTLVSIMSLTVFSADEMTSAQSSDGRFYMNYGAEVRVDEKKGLRFSASITRAQLEAWQTDGELSFGMVMLPYDYINTYGELTVENIFGNNAVYSFEEGSSKPKIENLSATPIESTANGNIYTLKAVKADLADSELDTYYSALAYVKITNGSNTTYKLAACNEGAIENTTRSVRTLARSAYNYNNNTAGGAYDAETVAYLKELVDNTPQNPNPEPERKITDIAVYSTYNFSTMKDVHSTVSNTPLAWRGNNESDRANIYAGYELLKLYEEITGKTLPVSYISSTSELDSTKRYFVLGSELAIDAGLNFGGITSDNGHKLVKHEGNIYLYGKSGYGTVNAVYEFLRQAFGIEFFSDTVYTLADNSYVMTDISDAVFNPSVDYNWAIDGSLFLGEDKAINYTYQFRLGFVNYWQIQSGNIHGFETLFPESSYPSYYASNGVLDLNSAGDFTTDNAMVKAVADWIYSMAMKKDAYGRLPNMTLYAFGPQDRREWSDSSASKANLEKYGSNSAEYILFMNAVAERLDTEYPDLRKIDVLMMAYNEALDAPTSSDSSLRFYQGNNVSLKVMFAPIEMNMNDSTDSTVKDFYGGKPTEYFAEYQKWQTLAGGEDNVYVWRYSAIFSDYFMPLNATEHIGEHYKTYVGSDNYIKHLVDQGSSGNGDNTHQTNYAALMVYLKGQLGRQANADVDALIDKFCRAYYGAEAGVYIKELILAQRKHLNTLKDTASDSYLTFKYKDPSGCHWIASDNAIYAPKYWSADCKNDGGAMLKEWYAIIENALASTSNEEERQRIKIEAIAIRYISLRTFNSGVFDTDNMQTVENDAKSLGINYRSEGTSIDKLT